MAKFWTFSLTLYSVSSIAIQSESWSCPKRMQTTRSSSTRMACSSAVVPGPVEWQDPGWRTWSTCQPLWRLGCQLGPDPRCMTSHCVIKYDMIGGYSARECQVSKRRRGGGGRESSARDQRLNASTDLNFASAQSGALCIRFILPSHHLSNRYPTWQPAIASQPPQS